MPTLSAGPILDPNPMRNRTHARKPADGNRRGSDVASVIALLLAAMWVIAACYERTWACLALLSVLGLLTVIRWHQPLDLRLGACGLILGPAMEWLAVRAGLWTYAHSDWAGLPFWTLPMWWMFPVTATHLTEGLAGRGIKIYGVTLSFMLMLAVTLAMCWLGNSQPFLALAASIGLLACHLFRHRERVDVLLAAICAGIGALTEVFLVATGAWVYPASSIAGLPIWLPTGYAAYGVGLIGLGKSLTQIGPNRRRQTAAPPTATIHETGP
jgi:hypothetical protein